MKRTLGLLLAALLSLFLLAGCGMPGSGSSSAPKKEEIPFENGQLYAVAWLGYQEIGDLDAWEKYVDTADLPVLCLSQGDFYLIVPRYEDTEVSVSREDIETGEKRLVYEKRNSGPFILQCNESDIFSDAVIRMIHEEKTVEFSPFLSLESGQLDVGEDGLVLTDNAGTSADG